MKIRSLFLGFLFVTSSAAMAAGFDCTVKPGPFVGYRDPGKQEFAFQAEFDGPSVLSGKFLQKYTDGRESIAVRNLTYKLAVMTDQAKKFVAGAYERGTGDEGNDVVLSELKLKKGTDQKKWTGTIFDDGVEFEIDCTRN